MRERGQEESANEIRAETLELLREVDGEIWVRYYFSNRAACPCDDLRHIEIYKLMDAVSTDTDVID